MRKFFFSFSLFCSFSLLHCQEQDSSCDDGAECLPIDDCKYFSNEREKLEVLSSSSNEYKTIIENIKNNICNKRLRKVCCVKTTIATRRVTVSQDSDCDAGYECKEINDCQYYQTETTNLKKLNRWSTAYRTVLKKLKSLICNKAIRKVCCQSDRVQEPDSFLQTSLLLEDSPGWVPSPGECGLTGNPAFILNGEETIPGEYPWMALLGKENQRGIVKWTCGGTLINKW